MLSKLAPQIQGAQISTEMHKPSRSSTEGQGEDMNLSRDDKTVLAALVSRCSKESINLHIGTHV